MKTILLINDDGIESPGLITMKKKLEKLGEVFVIAPMEERSGIGKAITSSGYVQIVETRLRDGSKAYATNGTPADAFLLAVNKILKHPPDLLVAGINLGANLGIDDLLNSGTLGAALEAAIHGVPAIAVSYCKREFIDQRADKASITKRELEFAVKLAHKIVEYVLKNGMPQEVDVVSVNVPENADCEKLRVTNLSYVGYRDIWTEEKEGYRIASWKLADYEDANPETDMHVVKKGYISITPIKVRLLHNRGALESMIKNIHFE
ncbi:MAG: 5'/3'-nucleotidase SurE [Candidatus Bathyarchaeia archaeon]